MNTLMNTPDILGWVKRSNIEIVQISELSNLTLKHGFTKYLNDFGYDLSDTQDGRRC